VSAIADCESKYKVIGFVIGCQTISLMICQIHMASFVAYVAAMYSDSAVDSVISSCFFEDQETAPPLTRKTYPEIACLYSCEDPSALVYPSSPLSVVPYINL
jgi:hypothetical protein